MRRSLRTASSGSRLTVPYFENCCQDGGTQTGNITNVLHFISDAVLVQTPKLSSKAECYGNTALDDFIFRLCNNHRIISMEMYTSTFLLLSPNYAATFLISISENLHCFISVLFTYYPIESCICFKGQCCINRNKRKCVHQTLKVQ